MVLKEGHKLLHWNYFLALESDLERVSRYVEFTEENYKTYSLEMAHLLLAACSEVDVVLKGLCKKIKPEIKAGNIGQCRKILVLKFSRICDMNIRIPRYGLEITPWDNWKRDKNPYWWDAYNNVKHHRDEYFSEATLRNTKAAVAGLFVILLFFYQEEAANGRLVPSPKLLSPECIITLKQTDFGVTLIYTI